MQFTSIAIDHPNEPPLPDRSCCLIEHSWVIDHKQYHCPIYLWLSNGRYRDGEIIVFLFIEYRDVDRASRYCQWQFQSHEQALTFIEQHATTVSLPAISGKQTRQHPIPA
ncbi:hypothetical protein MIB92_07905 [Aestuariirhabdus sp. Z084]|uniref:hypothetical protein n=1 Tax=Aestuariirhabdus haliotis TaxID=2918751 RepID=UPI00201B39D3|nr:hypothetical protein [Aestuariirhabdus haliotis]MCL6415570.1 hypothetical protein [Aestuariirhabdus haliotis]MCL6419225.1 hypothetical protein [Aestuariirhabdus haliotis]